MGQVLHGSATTTEVVRRAIRHGEESLRTLVRAGVDVPTIQRISGHKTLAMVLRYVHMQFDHVDASISALDAPLPGAVTQGLHTTAIPDQPTETVVVAISSAKSAA